MKYQISNITHLMFGIAMSFFITSCDTDVESVDLNEPGIESQSNALYNAYLNNLRTYKNSAHKAVFGWFDNSVKSPASQGQSIVAVPDSLDYLVVTNPSNLNAREYTEIGTILDSKGIRTLYEINYNTISAAYDAEKQAFEEDPANEGKTFKPDFNSYLVEKVQEQLTYCEQYDYAGVVMTFYAKTKLYMTEQEKATQRALENDFLGIAKDWKERHAGKMLVLAGKPQNVDDKTILDAASYIIIPCTDATDEGGVTYNFVKAAVDGVPTNKFVPLVMLYSTDPTDTKTGYWGDRFAAIGAARFCAAVHSGYKVAGLALGNINSDYYHANFVYPVVREAISIVNPTVQK